MRQVFYSLLICFLFLCSCKTSNIGSYPSPLKNEEEFLLKAVVEYLKQDLNEIGNDNKEVRVSNNFVYLDSCRFQSFEWHKKNDGVDFDRNKKIGLAHFKFKVNSKLKIRSYGNSEVVPYRFSPVLYNPIRNSATGLVKHPDGAEYFYKFLVIGDDWYFSLRLRYYSENNCKNHNIRGVH